MIFKRTLILQVEQESVGQFLNRETMDRQAERERTFSMNETNLALKIRKQKSNRIVGKQHINREERDQQPLCLATQTQRISFCLFAADTTLSRCLLSRCVAVVVVVVVAFTVCHVGHQLGQIWMMFNNFSLLTFSLLFFINPASLNMP